MRVATGLLLLLALTACHGSSETPVPARLLVVAGDGVSAPAGDTVDVAVRIVDSSDRPVAGALVAFQVIEGQGTVAPAEQRTGADGLATARWQLDAGVVINRLNASGVNGMHAILTATGVPGPVVSIEKAGDRQFAATGSVITTAFRLRDRLGNRAPGAPVTCTVDAGGGAANPGPSPDPAWDGVCAWTLGATPRVENLLTVRAGTAPPAVFTAWTAVPSPLTVRPSSDVKGSRTGVSLDPFGIGWAIQVDSTLEVASVTAHVGGLTTSLAKGTSVFDLQKWVGFTAGGALPRGTVVARVTAVDVRGNEGDLFLWFELDRRPALTITSPIDQSLARSEIAVDASCADDDPAGCTSLTASLGAGTAPPLTGTASVAGTFSLAGLQAGAVAIDFTARDSAGHVVTATRTVWLEPSPNLALVGTAPGEVLDAAAIRAFFQLPGEIGIADLATGGATTTPLEAPVQTGFLWPGGAAFVTDNGFSQPRSWVPGAAPVSIGPMQDGTPLQVAGRFALVTRVGQGPGELLLVRIDLASGSEVTVTTVSGSFFPFQADLAATGDVVFVRQGDVWRYRDGATPLVALTQDGQARGWPRTDGTRVLYLKEVGAADVRAVIWDGADQVLGPASGCAVEPCLALSGAWSAFYQPGPSGLGQLWRSGPGGLEQVTFFSQPSSLEGLTPDGVVVFRSGSTRYRSAPGALDPLPVGSANGRVVIRDGKALVLLGRSVLEIVP